MILTLISTVWASTSSFQAAAATGSAVDDVNKANKSFNIGKLYFRATQSGVDDRESAHHVGLDSSGDMTTKVSEGKESL
jgi:hypothetical protein